MTTYRSHAALGPRADRSVDAAPVGGGFRPAMSAKPNASTCSGPEDLRGQEIVLERPVT